MAKQQYQMTTEMFHVLVMSNPERKELYISGNKADDEKLSQIIFKESGLKNIDNSYFFFYVEDDLKFSSFLLRNS